MGKNAPLEGMWLPFPFQRNHGKLLVFPYANKKALWQTPSVGELAGEMWEWLQGYPSLLLMHPLSPNPQATEEQPLTSSFYLEAVALEGLPLHGISRERPLPPPLPFPFSPLLQKGAWGPAGQTGTKGKAGNHANALTKHFPLSLVRTQPQFKQCPSKAHHLWHLLPFPWLLNASFMAHFMTLTHNLHTLFIP